MWCSIRVKKVCFLKCTLFLILILFLVSCYPLYLLCNLSKLPLKCSSRILTTSIPIYLEEMLWAYTTLWSIGRMNLTRRSICVPKAIVEELANIFQSLSLSTSNTLPLICNYEIGGASLISPSQYADPSLNEMHISINFTDKIMENPKLVLYSAKYMDKEFVISENLTAFANRAIKKNSASINWDNFDSPPLTVCVWVKRPNWFPVSRYFKRARENYFRYSLDIFRKYYRPLFIVIGDVRWTEDTLEGEDIIFVRTKSVGQLLAIMAVCNHTIIEPTPLSLWGAFRNQGYKIVYGLPPAWNDLLWGEKDWMLLNLHPNGSFGHHVEEDFGLLGPLDFLINYNHN